MPIYEYECPSGHVMEFIHIGNPTNRPKTIHCSCLQIAEQKWSQPANIQIGLPTVVFRDQFGRLDVPADSNDPTPIGHVREEYRGPIERARLEKEFQSVEDEHFKLRKEAHKQIVEEKRKARHADIKANLSKLGSVGQQVMKDAMAYTNKKKPKDPPKNNTIIKANH